MTETKEAKRKVPDGVKEDRHAPVPNCLGLRKESSTSSVFKGGGGTTLKMQHSDRFTNKDLKQHHNYYKDHETNTVRKIVKELEGVVKEGKELLFRFGEADTVVESSPLKKRRITTSISKPDHGQPPPPISTSLPRPPACTVTAPPGACPSP